MTLPPLSPVVSSVSIGPYRCGDGSLLLIADPCVLETEALTLRIAAAIRQIADRHGVSIVFKASFDKANRTSLGSSRGPGIDDGLAILQRVKQATGLEGNNLAYLFATDENADLERAEELADVAVAGDPTNDEYRDTRGMIRQRRGNLKGAAVDFQKALEGSSDPAKHRRRLAAIYHQMGRKDLAEAYERGLPAPQDDLN